MFDAMQVVGIPTENQMQSFTAVAATMAVGQIVMETGVADGGDEKAVLAASDPAVIRSSELLSVQPEALAKALVSRQIHARSESYDVALTVAQAKCQSMGDAALVDACIIDFCSSDGDDAVAENAKDETSREPEEIPTKDPCWTQKDEGPCAGELISKLVQMAAFYKIQKTS